MGPLEVRVADQQVRLGGAKQRALLAVLLLHANRVVPVERLIDLVWGENPPTTVTVQVQAHVSALRRLLAEAGADREVIVTQPPGYLIRVDEGQLDLDLFERQADDARSALTASRANEAAAGFAAALGLWRGAPFSDVAGAVMPAEIAALEERRLAVVEERVEADLALGRHADLVPELTALTAEHPLRERLRGQLMVSLDRCGRQADALAVYRHTREVLVEELGLEPGPELRDLERSILAGTASPRPSVAGPSPVPPPAQLPADVADFTGRSKLVTQVYDQLRSVTGDGDTPRAVVVTAVIGKAGVGKTTLAVHVAHRLSECFPDGQLHVNLRGVETDPVDPAGALEGFLHALGVDGALIPDGLEERAAMYRSRLAGKRMLVLLDNAADETQVRPLLPGASTCAVLITSRARLAGLEGASLLDLDVLVPVEAVELLARIAGWQRITAERSAAERIVDLCGALPLAVRIAGARLAARPHWSLDRLATLLADERGRLDELQIGDLEVRASLTLSYDGLDQTTRTTFRRLGLLRAPDVAGWVAAALLDAPLRQAERALERLVDAQLLEVTVDDATGQGRYRLHDLLRVYACERVEAEDTPNERDQALRRALGGWLALTEQASESLVYATFWIHHGAAQRWYADPSTTESLLTDPPAWFESERLCLVAGIEQAAAADLSDLAWDLANSFTFFLQLQGQFGVWMYVHKLALAATRRAGDHRGSAIMLRGLSEVQTYQDRYDEALQNLELALTAFREAGDRHGEADVFCGFGLVYRLQGRLQEALETYQRALTLLDDVGDRPDKAYAMLGVGLSHLEQDRPDAAEAPFETALAAFRACGYRRGEAQALHRLGLLHRAQQRIPEAVTCLKQALRIFADFGERHSSTYTLFALGETCTEEGKPHDAEAMLERCLETFRELGDLAGEARTLQALGDLYRADGRHGDAVACFRRSAEVWQDLDLDSRRATALACLGDAQEAAGDRDAARDAWLEAARLLRRLGDADSGELAHRLEEQASRS